MGKQRDPVRWGGELVQWALHEKTSYLLGRMSFSVIPLRRAASQGGRLSSGSAIACFF